VCVVSPVGTARLHGAVCDATPRWTAVHAAASLCCVQASVCMCSPAVRHSLPVSLGPQTLHHASSTCVRGTARQSVLLVRWRRLLVWLLRCVRLLCKRARFFWGVPFVGDCSRQASARHTPTVRVPLAQQLPTRCGLYPRHMMREQTPLHKRLGAGLRVR
jgi:hypothetical protein